MFEISPLITLSHVLFGFFGLILARIAFSKILYEKCGIFKSKKAADECWKWFYYLISGVTAGIFAYKLGILQKEYLCWTEYDFPTHNNFTHFSHHGYLFQLFYHIEIGFSLAAFPLLYFKIEENRSDIMLLYGHHFVTFCLLAGSNWVGMEKIGLLVLFLHDCSDVFLEFAKFSRSQEFPQWTQNLSFVICLASWVVFRLIYFPFWVLWTIVFDSSNYIKIAMGIPFFCHKAIFLILLGSLLIMHFYWSYLLGKIVYNFLVKGEVPNDIREKKEK